MSVPQTHTMFNLSDVIEDLPAARDFLWYSRVTPLNRPSYLYLLGKLITLFTLPHTFKIYPFTEPSYFKKYEAYFKNVSQQNEYVTQLLHVLSINTDTVEFMLPSTALGEPRVIVDEQTAAAVYSTKSSDSLYDLVKEWFENSTAKSVLAVHVSLISKLYTSTHANLLVLKKSESNVKYLLFDPHGSPGRSRFKKNLATRLEHSLSVPCLEVSTFCPMLQTEVQGGNCLQWVSMILCFFCLRPTYFDDPEPLYTALSKHPELNILLFCLSFFLRTMSFFKLSGYYYIMFVKLSHMSISKQIQERQNEINDSKQFNEFLYRRFSEVNCSALNKADCPESCTVCDDMCASRASVRLTVSGACGLLTPKEMAKEMVDIFFKIKLLTRTLFSEVDRLNVRQLRQQVYSLREAKTLQDYVDMRYMTEERKQELDVFLARVAINLKRLREDNEGEPVLKRQK